MVTVLVMLAAAAGAVARYVVDQVVEHRTTGPFPGGTLLVNLSGSLLFGFVTGLSIHHGMSATPTAVLGAGFTGGYTTFSTWAWESLVLGETGELRHAALNVAGSFAAGLLVAAAGLGLALL